MRREGILHVTKKAVPQFSSRQAPPRLRQKSRKKLKVPGATASSSQHSQIRNIFRRKWPPHRPPSKVSAPPTLPHPELARKYPKEQKTNHKTSHQAPRRPLLQPVPNAPNQNPTLRSLLYSSPASRARVFPTARATARKPTPRRTRKFAPLKRKSICRLPMSRWPRDRLRLRMPTVVDCRSGSLIREW